MYRATVQGCAKFGSIWISCKWKTKRYAVVVSISVATLI